MPRETNKNKIWTEIQYYKPEGKLAYRPIGVFETVYRESGIVSGKTFSFYVKDINTNEYVKVNPRSTDDITYYVHSYTGSEFLEPTYTDDQQGSLGSAGMRISNLYPIGNHIYKSNQMSDYYTINSDLDACLRYYTNVFFVIVVVPWDKPFYVNEFVVSAVDSFKDMRITKNDDGSYSVLAKAPVGPYDVMADNMFYYDSENNRQLVNRSSTTNTFRLNESNIYSFVPKYDLRPACDNEENAARYINWPSYLKLEYKKFDSPTINIKNDKVEWNISQSNYVQIGYDVYFDDIYYVTTKDTSIEIPDKYKLGNHRIKVVVRSNEKTVNLGAYEISWAENSNNKKILNYTGEKAIAFIESDPAEISYVGTLSKPVVNLSKQTAVNKYAVGWDIVDFAEGYETYIDDETIANINRRVDVTVNKGYHKIKIIAYKNIDGVKYESAPTEEEFTLNAIPSPSKVTFTKNVADGGSVYWTRVEEAEASGDITEYTLVVNGIEYQTNGNTYTLEDLPIGTNTLEVKANFGPDTTYNSESTVCDFTDENVIKKLYSPTLKAEEIRDKTTKGVTSLKLSWDNVSYASGYVLDDYYEVYNDESGLWEGTHIEDDLIATSKEIKFNIGQGVGKHTYKVKAYYKELENDFTSDYSKTPDKAKLEVSKLKPITGLQWKSDKTNKHRDESSLIWDKVKDENYYRVFALKDGESGAEDSKGYVIKTGDNTSFDFDILNMSVVNNQLATANYDIYIRCYNYDTLYFQPSEISNRLIYDVIQLDKPVGLSFDNNTQTLSWNKVNMATSYIVYKVGEPNPITEVTTTSYTFPDLGKGFFKFYVIAKRTVMEEE